MLAQVSLLQKEAGRLQEVGLSRFGTQVCFSTALILKMNGGHGGSVAVG